MTKKIESLSTIPLESLILEDSFRRNYDILIDEAKTAENHLIKTALLSKMIESTNLAVDHTKKFRGRKNGSDESHTKYMKDLCKRYKEKSARELFAIALEDAGSDLSPFIKGTKGELLISAKSLVEMPFKTFANKISKIKNPDKR